MAKHFCNLSCLIIILIFLLSQALMAKDKDDIEIGIVLDGTRRQSFEFIKLLKKEILELTAAEFHIVFPEDKTIDGGWNINKIKSGIDQLLADQEIDIIVTLGVMASDNIAKREKLSKIVIAPFIFEIEMQKIPYDEGTSGIKNLNYIHIPFISKNTLLDFRSIIDYKNMLFLLSYKYLEAIPGIDTWIQKFAENLHINLKIITVDDSIDEVFKNFPQGIDAVYVSPLLHIYEQGFLKLVQELKLRKLPSFSILGIDEVRMGILATNMPEIFPRIARRIALNIQRILLGEEPENIPVDFDPGDQLTINMETARAINVSPKLSVLTESELINEDVLDSDRSLNLNDAVNEAIIVNLDILAKNRYTSAGSQDIRIARSNLLPQIDLSATGLLIDKDRAEASFGSQPERTLSGSLSGRQILYSEPAWANLSIQKSVQISRESELEQLRLDIGLAVANAFLNVLRMKTFEKIQKENLKYTKSNLEISHVRETVGNAGPAEVYRWESELANNRNNVIQAMMRTNLARIELNRLLHRAQNERFMVLADNIYTKELLDPESVIKKYMEYPNFFASLQDFLVKEGLNNAPELKVLAAIIAAQERALSSAKNRFWQPSLALQGQYNNIFSKSGAGSNIENQLPGISKADDTFWNVALNLSFPLFKGGEKFANRIKVSEELEQLRLEYQSVSDKIEQNIRSALYIANASYAAITQTKLAAQAARKSLNVVQDAYARGVISILDLLDAQNTTLIAEQLASNAVYDFIIDLMAVERSVGKLYLLLDEQEAREFINRINANFNDLGL